LTAVSYPKASAVGAGSKDASIPIDDVGKVASRTKVDTFIRRDDHSRNLLIVRMRHKHRLTKAGVRTLNTVRIKRLSVFAP